MSQDYSLHLTASAIVKPVFKVVLFFIKECLILKYYVAII